MSILDRILLILLSIGGVFSGAVFALMGMGAFGNVQLPQGWIVNEYPINVYAIVLGVILLFISLRFLFYRLGGVQVDYVLLPGEHGNVRISYETIEQLANRTGKSIRGVQDFTTRIRTSSSGIVLYTRVRALPDIEFPRMTEEIQNAVKTYIEHTAGVHVEQIIVNIVELAGPVAKSAKAWVE